MRAGRGTLRGLLLLHGFTGSGASWQPFLEALADVGDGSMVGRGQPPWDVVVTPDLLGHGEADDRAGSFDEEIERLASFDLVSLPSSSWVVWHPSASHDVECDGSMRSPWHLLEGAGFRDVEWDLVGYSLGARVGLGLVCRYRERFRRVTLVGVNPGLADGDDRRARRDSDAAWARRLEDEGLDAFVQAWSAQPLFATQDDLDQRTGARQASIRSKQKPEWLARSLRVLGLAEMPSYWDALADLTMPVELVVGEKDLKFTKLAEQMLERLPLGQLTVVAGVGHNVLLEAPDRLADIVLGHRLGDRAGTTASPDRVGGA